MSRLCLQAPAARRALRTLLVIVLATPLAIAGGMQGLPASAASGVAVAGLTVNGRIDPLGIGADRPTFGWRLTSPKRSARQSSYELRVGRRPGSGDVWSSGRVSSDRQVGIGYGGPALVAATRYWWSVRVWDGNREASAWSPDGFFETGLLSAADWGGAQWIARPSVAGELERWTDYSAVVDLTLDNAAFGVFLRGSDVDNGYMWQLNVTGPRPALRPHLKIKGNYTLLGEVDLGGFGFTDDGLRTGRHTLRVDLSGTTIATRLDGVLVDTRTDSTFAKGYVGFRTHSSAAEKGTVHDVVVTRPDGAVLLDAGFADGRNPFRGGDLVGGALVVSGTTDALYDPGARPLPLLRKQFSTTTGRQVASARVYASALGVYELTVNGRRVGDQVLAPGWTNYRERIQAQTYDVTDLLQQGGNVLGAALAPGWWAGKVGLGWSQQYGDTPALVARLRIVYRDGTVQWIDSDGSWRAGDGPFVQADLQDGESYDARAEPPGWSRPGFDASGWAAAASLPSLTSRLVPQSDEPVREKQVLDAKKQTEPVKGSYVYDLGQNMVGVARVTLTGTAGQAVQIRYAEVLNKDGTLYVANFRTAKVTDRYVFGATGTVTYQPRFTQHGFRYVEVSGVSAPPALADVKGVVLGSDLRSTGTLQTSDAMLNQLVSNISWSQRGNFLSIPTDTPARDERLGWTGDISLFAPTAAYLVDARAFLSHWMADVRSSQYANGDLPAVVPTPQGQFGDSGVGWDDVMITVPYAVWRAYGDDSILRENYAAMQKFMEFARTSAGPDLLETGRTTFFTNDWLNLGDPTVQGVLGTAYLAEDARMMGEVAQTVGDTAAATRYATLAGDVRRAFTTAYVAADGTVAGNSQTGYALALGLGLVADPALVGKVGQKFVAKLAQTGYHLRTGFIGTPLLLPALSAIGRDDLAYTMLLHRDYPSWGYEVANGGTTMWERWNSIMPDGSFGPVDMNSFNHYAYGAVGDWMFRTIGGLSPIEPGYRRSRVAPVMGGGLTSGSGRLETVYGPLSSAWSGSGDSVQLAVTVPVNTVAEVHVPAVTRWAVTESGRPAASADGVRFLRMDGGSAVFEVGSGSYRFGVDPVLGGVGDAADGAEALRALVAPLKVLGAAGARRLTEEIKASVREAWEARVAGDGQKAVRAIHRALEGLNDVRRWTGQPASVGGLRAADAAAVRGLLDRIAAALSTPSGLLLGITATIELPGGEVLPGATVPVTIAVRNAGQEPVTSPAATLQAGTGWPVRAVGGGTAASLAPGETARFRFEMQVPVDAESGTAQLRGAASYTYRQGTATLPAGAAIAIAAPVTLGSVTLSPATVEPGTALTASVMLTNRTGRALTRRLTIEVPDGWTAPAPVSYDAPSGATVTVPVRIDVPLAITEGQVSVVAATGVSAAERGSGTATVTLANPPANIVDHVDVGDAASETAHGISASASSGTSTEAGLTRRYTNNGVPDGWFELDLTVPAGKAFLVRAVETYNMEQLKTYDVLIDGQVALQRRYQRTATGAGTVTYQFVVQPSAATADGRVRIRFQDVPGDFDPSIADVWVAPVN